MIPGMNPRQMKQAMRRLGIEQHDLPATEVIIRLPDKEIVISEPSVQKVNMMGQWTYQISGEEKERSISSEPEITDDDIKTVVEQTGCSEDEAKAALEKANGDLAQAILDLSK